MIERLDTTDRWGPLTGVAFVVLIVVSQVLQSSPADNASGTKVIAYYVDQSHKRSADISAFLVDLGVVVGLFFFGYLRAWLRRTDLGARLAPVAFGGAVIFALSGLLAAGTAFALTDVPQDLSPGAAQALNVIQSNITLPATAIGVSVLTLATSIVVLGSRLLPAWFGWFGVVIAVVGVAGPFGFFAFPAVGLWILVLSYFWSRRRSAAVEATLEPSLSR